MRSITFWDSVQDARQGIFSLTRISLPLSALILAYSYKMRLAPLIAAAFSG